MPVLRKHCLHGFACLSVVMLWASNFVSDHFLQIYHFTYSTGTLLVQLAFSGMIVLSEMLGFRKTARLIWQSGFINLIVAFIAFFLLQMPIPAFWVEHEMAVIEKWQQLDMVIMFSIGYICSAYAMLYSAGILHIYFRRNWLLLRIIFITVIGMIVDTFVLSPILLFTASDTYLGWWKILSLVSVKFSLSLYVVPFTYLLITIFGVKTFFQPRSLPSTPNGQRI